MTSILANRSRWFSPAAGIAVLVLALALPPLMGAREFTLTQFDAILALVVVALGLNIAMGMAGQFALGIIAVFSVSGFAVAWATTKNASMMSLFAMCVLGAVVGAIAGLILALPALRVGQFYLALVTLYAAVVVPSVAQHMESLGGEAGLALFVVPDFLPRLEGFTLYAVMVGIVAIIIVFSAMLKRSSVGYRFAALAASEQMATSIGISAYRTKVLGVVLGSAVAGVAGGMYVYSQQFFGHTVGGAHEGILILAAIMIGGFATLSGTVIGVVLVFGFNQFVIGFEQYTGVIFGIFLLFFTLFMPNGLVDKLRPIGSRLGLTKTSRSPLSGADLVPSESGGEAGVRLPLPKVPTTEVLTVDSVARSFGGVKAVDGVGLTVVPGKLHGLIGSNGSGKTTLLNLISGYYKLDAGSIRLGNKQISGHSTEAIARLGVSRTFQTPKLITTETVIDNIIPAAARTVSVSGFESVFRVFRGRAAAKQTREAAMSALDRLAIGHLANEKADSLPHGTRRLVEIARVIAMQPRFLLCDEPAAGLSPAEAEVMVNALVELAESGTGVLLIEHNVPMVLEIASSVTVLHQGKKLFEGTPEELRADEGVASAFLGLDAEKGQAK